MIIFSKYWSFHLVLKGFIFAFTGLPWLPFIIALTTGYSIIIEKAPMPLSWVCVSKALLPTCLRFLWPDMSLYVYSNLRFSTFPLPRYLCRVVFHLGSTWKHLGKFYKSCCPGPSQLQVIQCATQVKNHCCVLLPHGCPLCFRDFLPVPFTPVLLYTPTLVS